MSLSSSTANPSMRGFTMIEILVTLVILMIGLLGIAGLMAQGQRASFEAYQRQQALALANDMAERIKANRPGVDSTVVATTYVAAVPLATPAGTGTRFSALATDCATTNCTPSDVVQYDAAIWDGLLSGGAGEKTTGGAGLGPILKARGCIEALPPDPPPACACGGAPASQQIGYRISVAWQGNYATAAPTGANTTCGRNQYRNPASGAVDEDFRRLVSVDVLTVLACACP